MPNKKKIVVTGGAGFVGTNLIKLLLKKTTYKIISIDNYSSGKRINHIKNSRVKYVKGKTSDVYKLIKNPKEVKTLFHFGEFARIYQSFLKMNECIQSNTIGSNSIFNFCLKNNIKLIYSATSSNLGNKGKDESLSPYAWSKTKNIELIKNYSRWFGLKYELVYFYNVYGPGQILNSPMAAVIGIFINQYNKKKPLTVVRPGTQRRDFTHIDDIVRGCWLALTKGKQNEYMLGTKKTYSIIDLAKMFKSKIKYLPSRMGDRTDSTMINNNAKKILRYKSTKSITTYIKNFINKK